MLLADTFDYIKLEDRNLVEKLVATCMNLLLACLRYIQRLNKK